MKPYKPLSHVDLLIDLFRLHPGAGVSILYASLTLCGIFYSDRFYAEFSIPFLQLAETSDLLIVGIRNPAAILMLAGGLVIALALDHLTLHAYETQEKRRQQTASFWQKMYEGTLFTVPKYQITATGGVLLAFIAYGMLFIHLYADWQADLVKSGKGDQIILGQSESGDPVTSTLLGATANFVFVYNPDDTTSVSIPVETVSKIQTLSKNEASIATPMEQEMIRLKGSFTVEMAPANEDNPHVGRMLLNKQYEGPLSGTGRGQMMSHVTQVKGSAGYVALEHVEATVEGKQGTFSMQHYGLMNKGAQSLVIDIIPDSASGELTGLTGKMHIDIKDGKHYYTLEYLLPE